MPARRRERIRSTLRRESRGLAPSRVQRVVCDLPARRPLFVCQASGLIAHDASESNPPPGCAAFRRDVLGGFEQEATERTEEGRRHDFRYLCVLLFLPGSGVVCNLFARRVESMADIAATRERGERVPAQAGAVSLASTAPRALLQGHEVALMLLQQRGQPGHWVEIVMGSRPV